MLAGVQQRIAHADGARSRETLRRLILDLPDCLSSLERCAKPVIAAIQGACVGGARPGDLLRYALRLGRRHFRSKSTSAWWPMSAILYACLDRSAKARPANWPHRARTLMGRKQN